MPEKIIPQPSIQELEKLIEKAEAGEIELLPSGDVVRLTIVERLEKNYRLEQEKNDLLHSELTRVRSVLAQIYKLARPTG